jgi:hypothetical protein
MENPEKRDRKVFEGRGKKCIKAKLRNLIRRLRGKHGKIFYPGFQKFRSRQ